MHRDKKLGLALGILLVGIVGAFFFRNEADPLENVPALESAESLDRQIAEEPIAPYLMPPEFSDGGRRRPSAADELPDFLRDDQTAGIGAAATNAGAPDPIVTRTGDLAATEAIPVPEHNRGWAVKTSAPAEATDSGPAAPAEARVHRVQPGETLSGLAQRYLGSSTRFMDLYAANRDILRSPDDLRVGMNLRIPAASGPRSPAARSVSTTEGVPARPASASQIGSGESTQAPSVPPPQPSAPVQDQRPRRFVPARRSPLWPVHGAGSEAARVDSPAGPIRTLSQVAPSDVPQAGPAQRSAAAPGVQIDRP